MLTKKLASGAYMSLSNSAARLVSGLFLLALVSQRYFGETDPRGLLYPFPHLPLYFKTQSLLHCHRPAFRLHERLIELLAARTKEVSGSHQRRPHLEGTC